MGLGKIMYWILWLPIQITGLIAMMFFLVSTIVAMGNQVAKELHNEIKEL